jgi:hypothetical protein
MREHRAALEGTFEQARQHNSFCSRTRATAAAPASADATVAGMSPLPACIDVVGASPLSVQMGTRAHPSSAQMWHVAPTPGVDVARAPSPVDISNGNTARWPGPRQAGGGRLCHGLTYTGARWAGSAGSPGSSRLLDRNQGPWASARGGANLNRDRPSRDLNGDAVRERSGRAASAFRLCGSAVEWGPSRNCPQICRDRERGLDPDVVIPDVYSQSRK